VAVRNEVWQRDCGQCGFLGSNERRCTSPRQLGCTTWILSRWGDCRRQPNLALRGRVHNVHAAEQDYGQQHIARKGRGRPGSRQSGWLGDYPRLW
jgi:hypothetical protein